MSSNYPEGSMRGSGIYSESWSGEMYCSNCDKDVEVEGSTNDWQTSAYADCPDCGKDLEKDIGDENEDDLYDSWRDSQLD